MRVSGSMRRRQLLLLLSLAALCLADPNTTGPTTETQATGHPTPEITSDPLVTQHNASTSAVHLLTQEPNHQTKEKISNLISVEHSINITVNLSSATKEKVITLDSPANLRLLCNLALQSSDLTTIKVTWKKDNETIIANNTIANKKENQNILSDQHALQIEEKSQMGSYTCVFNIEPEVKATFHLQVPAVEGKEKPIISYEGDSVVLICQSANYTPVEWVWYMSNGSHEVAINDTKMPDKYEVTGQHTNKTKLKVQKILEKDGGWYHCQAVFKLGESKGKVNIKVLSYMVPLKPFFAIAAEVVILVAIILLYEMYSKKKQTPIEDEKEFEQIEQLKSEESNGVESTTTRHRKV